MTVATLTRDNSIFSIPYIVWACSFYSLGCIPVPSSNGSSYKARTFFMFFRNVLRRFFVWFRQIIQRIVCMVWKRSGKTWIYALNPSVIPVILSFAGCF